jgi:hypothetical protein
MQAETSSQTRQATMSDAVVSVQWLNHAKGSERERIANLREELERLGRDLVAYRELHDASPVFKTVPSDMAQRTEYTAQIRHKYRQLQLRVTRLNNFLTRYKFHPGVGAVLITESRSAGLVPFVTKRGLRLRVGELGLVEADAALSLVRLYLTGELGRVQLCEMCKERWRVKSKSHYRFCSGECREGYYTKSRGYKERRKKIQQEYRDRKKRNKMLGYRPKS